MTTSPCSDHPLQWTRNLGLVAALTALLAITLAQPATAQRRTLQAGPEIGRGFFQAGYMTLDLDELNSSLVGAGYPALDDSFLTLGGGGYGNRGRFLIGGEGHALLGNEETTVGGGRQISGGGGYGLFRLGYLAFTRNRLEVFPTLGLGAGGLNLDVLERSAPTFGDVLTDPARSSSLSTWMFILDASVSLNYRIVMQREPGEGIGGLLLGVQGGYAFAPGSTSWDLDGINSVAGGPEFQIEGPYLRISIGGWGREAPDDRPARRRR